MHMYNMEFKVGYGVYAYTAMITSSMPVHQRHSLVVSTLLRSPPWLSNSYPHYSNKCKHCLGTWPWEPLISMHLLGVTRAIAGRILAQHEWWGCTSVNVKVDIVSKSFHMCICVLETPVGKSWLCPCSSRMCISQLQVKLKSSIALCSYKYGISRSS